MKKPLVERHLFGLVLVTVSALVLSLGNPEAQVRSS
jgi:hypothetical protein